VIPTAIVLHHSTTKDSYTFSWAAMRKYHVEFRRYREIGYHFGIELIGDGYEVVLGRLMNETGAHCQAKRMNHRSLGICFVGNFNLEYPPAEMWALGVRLVRSLIEVIPTISPNAIYGHRHFAQTDCPGLKFDFIQFMKEVGK
jgi:N-acetylmuramoyl-L-alanine amidase